jgi:hypothetical protein
MKGWRGLMSADEVKGRPGSHEGGGKGTSDPAAPAIAELRALTGELARLIEQASAQATGSPPVDIQTILDASRPAVSRIMNDLGSAVTALQSTAGTPNVAAIRDVALEPIRRWSATSPFYEAALRWQRNPSWFTQIEIADIRRTPAGATISAMIFDDFLQHTIAARAYVQRARLLATRVRDEVFQRREVGLRPVRLLSLSSGATIEAALAAADQSFASAVRVTFADSDPTALRDARRKISGEFNEPPAFVLADPLQLSRGPNRPARPFHIIHTLWGLDRLRDPEATTTLWACHELLETGGALIIGSIGKGVPQAERGLIELLLGIKLAYRNEADFRRLLARTPFGDAHLRFDFESLGANMVVTVVAAAG